ncbi:MAG: hypothetical protein U0795_21270 [Pirellulales bacterium]
MSAGRGTRSAAARARRLGPLLRLIHKRFGILLLIGLVGWVPAAGVAPLRPIFGNALLVDTYQQLAFVALLNTISGIFCVAVLRLLNDRFPGTWMSWLLGNADHPWETRQYLLAASIALVTPLCLFWHSAPELPTYSILDELGIHGVANHLLAFVLAIPVSVGLGFLAMMFLGLLKSWLVGSRQDVANFLPFEATDSDGWLTPWLGGWVAARPGRRVSVAEIDVQLAIYVALLAIIHFILTRSAGDLTRHLISAPAVATLLIWLTGMVFTGLSFWLDRFRLPTVPFVLAFAFLMQLLLGSTATFTTVADQSEAGFVRGVAEIRQAERRVLESKSVGERVNAVRSAAGPLEELAWQAVNRRMSRVPVSDPARGRTLVIVTCPGGGIHAAAWVTCVLESIGAEYAGFRDSICLISGVSGGSVGALFYVSQAYSDVLGGRKTGVVESAFERATASSLEPIAFGMMTDDLYGAFLPVLSVRDRGRRLEESFHRRLPSEQQSLTMGDWGDLAVAGRMPIVVFNATDAATGRRILFDTIPTPIRTSGIGLTSRPLNYRELLSADAGVDVMPASAARTSASFPYVSPWVRPDLASDLGRVTAIGDGGYVDNEGIVTAVDWIEFLLRRWESTPAADRTFQRILLLRISPASNFDDMRVPESSIWAGGARWLIGPLETMAKVRSASQSERGNLESDLAALYLESAQGTTPGAAARATAARRATVQNWSASSKAYSSRDVGAILMRQMSADPGAGEGAEQSLNTTTELVVGEPSRSAELTQLELPVIVKDVQFLAAPDQVLPLNWKLTRRQKARYPDAWEWNRRNDQLLIEVLNGCFARP